MNVSSKYNLDINRLITIIEHHEDTNFRLESLSLLEGLRRSDEEIFNLLENLILSDEEIIIRAKAAEILVKIYLKSSVNLIDWIFNNETAVLVFKSILNALKERMPQYYGELERRLLEKYSKIHHLVVEECVFFRDLDFMISKTSESLEINWPFRGDGIPEQREMLERELSRSAWDGFMFYQVNGHVKNLNLSNSELDEIPESIGNLGRLKDLRLHDNKLESLPSNMEHLKQLKILQLHNNRFKDIPGVLLSLKKLARITLGGNQIGLKSKNARVFIQQKLVGKYLSEGIDSNSAEVLGFIELLKGSPPLKTDDLEYPFDPDWFHEMDRYWYYNTDRQGHITELAVYGLYTGFLGSADLGFLMKHICSFAYLEGLYLYECNIEKIPTSIGKLRFLKNLYLVKNKIKKIPSSLKSLKQLEELNLSHNLITKMPRFLKDMKAIRYYYLGYNPIRNPSMPLDFDKEYLESLEDSIVENE